MAELMARMAEIAVSRHEADVLVALGLGSCIGVALLDRASLVAGLAHVVLPVYQWAEEEGTMTNLEGRVIRRRRVARPPSGVRGDIDILRELADRLGCGEKFAFRSPAEVTAEIRPDTLFAPFHWGGRDAANRLINPALDPTSRMPEFKLAAVRIVAVTQGEPHA